MTAQKLLQNLAALKSQDMPIGLIKHARPVKKTTRKAA